MLITKDLNLFIKHIKEEGHLGSILASKISQNSIFR